MQELHLLSQASQMLVVQTIRYTIFTARKRSLRRLCFYTCLSTGGTWAGTPPGKYPPWAGTPPWPGTPQAGTPWAGTPPWAGTQPREQCMLGDMGNKRAVCILLECILVLSYNFHISSQWYRFEQLVSRIRLQFNNGQCFFLVRVKR